MYSEEMTRVVLVPTWDKSGKYYMGRTKVGLDELSVMATTFSNYVASNEKEIMDHELVVDKMSGVEKNSHLSVTADELIDSLYNSMKEFGCNCCQRVFSAHNESVHWCFHLWCFFYE